MWFLLAAAAALFQVLRNMTMKQLGHRLDEYINVWGRFTFLLPFTLVMAWALVWRVEGWPDLKPGFVPVCLAFGVCQCIATLALSKALKLGDLSTVTALWKVSLIILLVMGYLTLREQPSLLGLAGVLLSTAGVYLLNVRRARLSPLAPAAALVTEPGLRWTLVAAFFYAPSVLTIKQAALLSDPYTGSFGGYLAASLLVTPLVLATSRQHFRQVPANFKAFVGLGLFAALTTVSQVVAYTMTLSSYVEAVKQVEILFALLIGAVVFGERQRVREISLGAGVILAGMVLLSLAGVR
ncbi:MAG: EamA family transporter [Candidatus Rokubacteria bacterium]|nr:EamA family transporter [Candidatus Rokubacteria bacterium]